MDRDSGWLMDVEDDSRCAHGIRYPHECRDCFEVEQKRWERQKAKYEALYESDIKNGEAVTWEELSPETQSAVCEQCGEITDPEMPFEDGDTILCGGDECLADEIVNSHDEMKQLRSIR